MKEIFHRELRRLKRGKDTFIEQRLRAAHRNLRMVRRGMVRQELLLQS